MNKVLTKFVVSHIKKAIYEIECANKLAPGTVGDETIQELKLCLLENQIQLEGEKNEKTN